MGSRTCPTYTTVTPIYARWNIIVHDGRHELHGPPDNCVRATEKCTRISMAVRLCDNIVYEAGSLSFRMKCAPNNNSFVSFNAEFRRARIPCVVLSQCLWSVLWWSVLVFPICCFSDNFFYEFHHNECFSMYKIYQKLFLRGSIKNNWLRLFCHFNAV